MLSQRNPLKNLPIWMKLGTITLLMSIPLVSLLYAFVSARQEAIALVRQELLGVEYLVPLKSLYEHLPQHRGLVAASLAGQSDQKDRLFAVQQTIEADFKALEALDQRLGKALDTTALLRELGRRWQEVKRQALEMKPAESFERHTQLIAETRTLIQRVGDTSTLILDPELDTYYLMDTVINRLPESMDYLSTLRGIGSAAAARKTLTSEEQLQLRFLVRQLKKSLEPLQRGLQVAYTANRALEPKLAPVVSKALEGSETFLRLVTERLAQNETVSLPLSEFFGVATEAAGRYASAYDATLTSLRELLEARVTRLTASRNGQVMLALLLTALAIFVALWMHRLVSRQIAGMQEVFAHIETGAYEARVPVLSQDELGHMAVSLNRMLDKTLILVQSQEDRESIQHSIMKLLEEVSGVADGDLTIEAEVTADMTGAIADSFNYMIYQLRSIVTQVQDATLHVSASANEIQATAEHLAEGSTAQAAQIIDSSAALDEMTVSIQQVSENASLSASVADQALANARQGTQAVQNTIQGMQRIRTQVQETAKRIKRLGERSQEIGEIVQLIGDIADRTSILALNASIQAARAGEAGRAFTVVAEEVERLSERASNATKQIAGLVNTIQSETNEAVTAMEESTREVVHGSRLADQAGQALGEIETVSARLAELMQSISQAARQQARGSENLSQAMSEISGVTQQTAAGTKQAVVSINTLAALADTLRESMRTFKLPANTPESRRIA
ncbi:MAG: methyl-accepting chemotaxis protein [Candidatus Tectimicrobiota bacterium]